MKVTNFFAMYCSIASDCLILNETRTEFADDSISARWSAVRLMISGLYMSSGFKFTSISGLLCLSTVRDGVSLRHSAAFSVSFIASRYD